MVHLGKLFTLKYGNRDYTDKSTLDNGNSLLISSQGVDNGAYGFFDIPLKYAPPIITVPRTGSIGYAFVQLNKCNATDDCIILTPLNTYTKEYLFYIASLIRKTKWRYNYGRKITPKRLEGLEAIPPESFKVSVSYDNLYKILFPKKTTKQRVTINIEKLVSFSITDIFNLERGQFHALDRLEPGECATISRTSIDNGLVGFHKKPKSAKIYPPLTITVSTVTGDAFLQTSNFIASDNVVMCMPKKKLMPSTLIFVVAAINRTKWRYSYGRQPYKRIFQKTIIKLPVNNEKEIDEKLIEKIVTNQSCWESFKANIPK